MANDIKELYEQFKAIAMRSRSIVQTINKYPIAKLDDELELHKLMLSILKDHNGISEHIECISILMGKDQSNA